MAAVVGVLYVAAMGLVVARSWDRPVLFSFHGSPEVLAVSLCGVAATLVWRRRMVRRWDWWLPAALVAVGLLSFPDSSRDWLRYLFDGEMIRIYHASPYAHLPAEFPHDLLYGVIRPAFWVTIPSPYGPLWQAWMVAVNMVAHNRMLVGVVALKLTDLAGLLAGAWCLFRLAGARAAFLWLINPVVLLNTVATPHLDVLIAAAVLAAFYWRTVAGRGALLGAAAMLKVHAVVFAPFMSRRPGRALGVLVMAVVMAGGLALALQPMVGFEWRQMWAANQAGGVNALDSLLVHNLFPGLASGVVFKASYGLFAVLYLGVGVAFWRRRVSREVALTLVSFLVPLCLTGLLEPWHFIIPLAWLLVLGRPAADWVVLFLSLLVLRSAVTVLQLVEMAAAFGAGGWALYEVQRHLSRPPRALTRLIAAFR